MARPRSTTATRKARRKRGKQITLWVSEAEAEAFRARADATDLALTTWIRLVCRRAVGMETP